MVQRCAHVASNASLVVFMCVSRACFLLSPFVRPYPHILSCCLKRACPPSPLHGCIHAPHSSSSDPQFYSWVVVCLGTLNTEFPSAKGDNANTERERPLKSAISACMGTTLCLENAAKRTNKAALERQAPVQTARKKFHTRRPNSHHSYRTVRADGLVRYSC